VNQTTSLVNTEQFSHWTIDCGDIAATRRFLNEFLGVDVVRPLPEAQYLWKGGPWSVVCVCIEDWDGKDQGPQNRFKLSVESAADVDHARDAALRYQNEYGIRQIDAIEERGGIRSFKLQDMNKVWWEITSLSQKHFDDLFAKGDA